jgi:hypothetical protein
MSTIFSSENASQFDGVSADFTALHREDSLHETLKNNIKVNPSYLGVIHAISIRVPCPDEALCCMVRP